MRLSAMAIPTFLLVRDKPNNVKEHLLTYLIVAMLIYGDAELWYLTRAEHFQYFLSVLHNSTHPRYKLYKKLNGPHASKHPLTCLRLSDRIKIPNCWVHHGYACFYLSNCWIKTDHANKASFNR